MEQRILEGVADVHVLGAATEKDLEGRIEDADAVMMYHNVSVRAQPSSGCGSAS